ncbi:MAG: NCS2 family permease, partial [Erysipelotrichaceae bacterium]|nr:NCS2 family permease [Erysipelotrichaceae bacterium]
MSNEDKKVTVVNEVKTSNDGGSKDVKSSFKKMLKKVDNFFNITKMGSSFKIEIIAGITTFMAMVYILMVNADMFSSQISYGAAYIATAIGAIVGTLLMAFLAKMPLAQASGMGVNAFVVFTLLSDKTGLTYANAMMITLVGGIVFIILTVTGLRKIVFESIPDVVKHAIPVGIGLFISFIGLQKAGIIVDDPSTLVTLRSFNIFEDGVSYGGVIPSLVAFIGVIIIAILSKKNIKGSILIGMVSSAVLYYVLAGIGTAFNDTICQSYFSIKLDNPFSAFSAWGKESFAQVFTNGFNFDHYLSVEGNSVGSLIFLLSTSVLSLCMIDMFDTIGTLYGACSKGNLLDENATPIRMNQMMLSDAIATCSGAIAGTSTVTTFVESSSGVVSGGKTGFCAFTTAVCFFIAMFLSPIAQLIPNCATAAVLIWVGVLMMSTIAKIDWTNPSMAIVAFLTFIVMILGYSISSGIGVGIISYILIQIL